MEILLKITLLSILSLIVISCGVNESEHNRIKIQRDSLKLVVNTLEQRIDILENGEERLMNLIKFCNSKNEFLKAYEYLEKLRKYHPESSLLINNNDFFSKIEKKAIIVRDSINIVVQDSIKLANINELGCWKIGNYVNDFDELTGEHYVYAIFFGSFSNTATAKSTLRIIVKVTKYSIDFLYDEYDDGTYENEKEAYCSIVNKELRKSYYREGYNSSYINKETHNTHNLEDILLEEGEYKFYLVLKDKSQYNFTINTEYLNNALVKAGLISIDEI